jgi:Siphovirus-type tail component, C-terminal domain
LARGRTFEWRGDDGSTLPFSRVDGYWVQEGVTGLGKPVYSFDTDSSADSAGMIFYGARAASRQVFIPMDVSALNRATLLEKKRVLNMALDPVMRGPGFLYITDANGTYRLRCHYVDGMTGDESAGVAGESNAEHWQRIGIVFQATDPYFEATADVVNSWGYSGNVPFFPILPIKLNPAQVLSDAAQPVTNNFFRNPSAEVDLTNWDTQWFFGTPTVVLTRDASLVPPTSKPNSFSVKSQSPADPSPSGPSQITAAVMTIGVVYTAHCWVYVPSGQPDTRLLMNLNEQSAPITAKDQWVWARVTFTASQTSNRMSVLPIASTPDGSNYLVYTDRWAISEGTILDPSQYIDGDEDNCHWTGTPENSTSYRDAVYAPTTINNPGTVEAYPIWTIVGPGTQVDIFDKTRNRRLTLNYTIAAGQVVIIDTALATVRLVDGTSLYRYLSKDDFFPLAPGNSSVTSSIIGAASGSSITVRFKPRLEALV